MSYSSEVLADSPLRYFHLEETSGTSAADVQGGTAGTYVGTLTLGIAGIVGLGAQASSSGSGYVSIPASGLTTTFSLEFWFKYSANTGSVLWRDNSNSGNGWLMLLSNSGADAQVRAAGSDHTITGLGTTLRDGAWHHIVHTFSGTSLVTYVDGSAVDTWARTTTSMPSTSFRFGRNGSLSTYYDNYYDEISVYTGVLSGSRVAAHYAAATGTDLSVTGQPSPALAGGALAAVALTAGLLVTGIPAVSVEAGPTATVALTSGLSVIGQPGVGVAGSSTALVQFTSAEDLVVTAEPSGGIGSGSSATVDLTSGLVVDAAPAIGIGAGSSALVEFVTPLDLSITTLPSGPVAAGPLAVFETSADIEIVALPTGTLAGAHPASVIIGILPIDADTSDSDDGLNIECTAEVEWIPAVVTTPSRYRNLLAMDTARAIVLNGIGPAGQPLISTQDARAPRTRDRVLLGGIDITYFRGVNTPTPEYGLIKPLLWGSGRLTLPQVNPQFERLGAGATDPVLARIKRDTSVVVQRVDADDNVVKTDHVGFIDSLDTSGPTLSMVLAGHGSGRCARQNIVPTPVFRRKHDLGIQTLDYLRRRGLRTDKSTQVLGIPMYDRGGTDGLTHVNELVNFAVKRDGTSYVVMPDEDSRVYGWQEVDRETVDFTFYIDSNLIEQQLQEAFSEEVDEAYVTARSNRGELIGFIDLPGLTQGEIPPYPGTLSVGSIGDDVVILHEQLTIMDFLDFEDVDDPGIYDDDTADAIKAVQKKAGLARTGEVDLATWRVVWNEQRLGAFSIDRARQRPAAEKDWVDPWLRNTDGSKLARNPAHDPHRVPSSRMFDLGTGWNQRRAQRYGESRLTPDDFTNWQGTVTFTGAVIRGEHTPGDPITADDVMPARDIRPGMNGMARYFDGDTLLHVSGVDFRPGSGGSPDTVTAMVDTLARNTMELAEVIARDRETRSKSNPVRSWSGQTRASSVHSDTLTDWIRTMGRLAHDTDLVGGWNRVVIPAGQEGVIQKIRIQLLGQAEFAAAIFQGDVSAAAMNARIPAPLSTPSGRPWYETADNWLASRGNLVAWGTDQQPCGYDPSVKNDANGDTGESPTGLFVEWGGFNYRCAHPGRLYLLIWVATDDVLAKGRILTQQITSPI